MLGALFTLELSLAGTGPSDLVELDTAALGLDSIARSDDKDDAKSLEVGRESAVVGPVALGVPGSG